MRRGRPAGEVPRVEVEPEQEAGSTEGGAVQGLHQRRDVCSRLRDDNSVRT